MSAPYIRLTCRRTSTLDMPVAYQATIVAEKPPRRVTPLGTVLGSNVPARSRATSKSTGPTSVRTLKGPETSSHRLDKPGRSRRGCFTWSDRTLVALLAGFVPRERWTAFVVTPKTVLDWHHRLVARRWTYPHRRPGRPPLERETVELIVRLAQEDPRWGYLRIVGELHKLAPRPREASPPCSAGTGCPQHHGVCGRPGHSCPLPKPRDLGDRLLRCRLGDVRHYCVGFVIEVDGRVVHLLGATANPATACVVQVARNLTSDLEDTGRRSRFLIRDRDTKFTAPSDEVHRASGTEAVRTPVRSPKANAFAERFVRTVWEDCLDRLLIYSMCHLGTVLVPVPGQRAR